MEPQPSGARPRLAPPPSTRSGVSGINVTPLIDVLLVLFIVFLVIVLLGRRVMPMTLPPTQPGPAVLAPIQLDVTLIGYRLNGQPIPAALLPQVLRAALSQRAARVVFIKTAPELNYQAFITAADLARGAGASIVAMVGPQPD